MNRRVCDRFASPLPERNAPESEENNDKRNYD